MKTLIKPTITTRSPELQDLTDDVNYESERPWPHAYPESDNEFDSYLIAYVRFMWIARNVLIIAIGSAVGYLGYKLVNWLFGS